MSESPRLNDAVYDLLKQFLERIPSVQSVLTTDKDGVLLVDAYINDTKPKDLDIEALSNLAKCSHDAGKLKMGTNQTITAFFGNRLIVQAFESPLVIIVVADVNANVGLILELMPSLVQNLESFRRALSRASQVSEF